MTFTALEERILLRRAAALLRGRRSRASLALRPPGREDAGLQLRRRGRRPHRQGAGRRPAPAAATTASSAAGRNARGHVAHSDLNRRSSVVARPRAAPGARVRLGMRAERSSPLPSSALAGRGAYRLYRARRADAGHRDRADAPAARAGRVRDRGAPRGGVRRDRLAVPRQDPARAPRRAGGLGARLRQGARRPLHGGQVRHDDHTRDGALRAARAGRLQESSAGRCRTSSSRSRSRRPIRARG